MKRRASAAQNAEAAIRQALGDGDYKLLVRYLNGSVRLLQKLESLVDEIPSAKRQIKMTAPVRDEVRRAIELLSDQLAGVGHALSSKPSQGLPMKVGRQLRMVNSKE